MPVCVTCKEDKPLEDFYPDKSRSIGVSSSCKSCQRKRFEAIEKRDPERHRLAHKLRALRYWHRKHYKLNESFTVNQIIGIWESQGQRCYYCAVLLALGDISVDHKNPVERGGTNGFFNLAVACIACNKAKGTMTEVEYRASLEN